MTLEQVDAKYMEGEKVGGRVGWHRPLISHIGEWVPFGGPEAAVDTSRHIATYAGRNFNIVNPVVGPGINAVSVGWENKRRGIYATKPYPEQYTTTRNLQHTVALPPANTSPFVRD